MNLIKYRDKGYSWFWTHRFDTGDRGVISEIFSSEEEALVKG